MNPRLKLPLAQNDLPTTDAQLGVTHSEPPRHTKRGSRTDLARGPKFAGAGFRSMEFDAIQDWVQILVMFHIHYVTEEKGPYSSTSGCFSCQIQRLSPLGY